jgi:repressor LexA
MEESIKKVVGKNLRIFRDKKSLYRIFKDTGITTSYLKECESGEGNPTIELLERLSKYYEVHIAEFFGVKVNPPPILEYKIEIVKKPTISEKVENYYPIPLLHDPVSLGPGLEISENDIEGTCLIHTSKLRKGGEYRAIKVKGDSMIPVLNDGDIVAVDVKQRNPRDLNNKIVVAKVSEQEVTIKLLKVFPGQFRFIALNSDWEQNHPPLITPAKDDVLLGKVVWAWKSFE